METRRFVLHRCIGRGGYGEVYEANMVSSGGLSTRVAVKLLRSDIDPRSDAVHRIRDEAHVLALLEHPSILRVIDLVVLEGRVGLVTELVVGGDLTEHCRAEKRMPVKALFECVGMLAEALQAARETTGADGVPLDLVHRDIKPSNIRLGLHGNVKLLDFGIARTATGDREARTASNMVVGSLPYMAPERFVEKGAGHATDIFGLGATLFEGLTGSRFYPDGMIRQVSSMALEQGKYMAFLSDRMRRLPQLPRDAMHLVEDMLQFDPYRRPDAAAVVARCHDLEPMLKGPGLRAWSTGHVWPEPPEEDGDLVGMTVPESMAGLDGPRPSDVPTLPPRRFPQPTRTRWMWATTGVMALGALALGASLVAFASIIIVMKAL
jgi:eukaryotic-like serine/threonine-protein kinase